MLCNTVEIFAGYGKVELRNEKRVRSGIEMLA